MSAIKKTILSIITTLLITGSVFALEGEFKNYLNKIELTKDAENSYSVNLYTVGQFNQTPKVIKKSDLNYYILLPETKNDVTTTVLNNNEIRSISTNLYPYAGEDINNGYTKININTTKPINFNVNVKNIIQASAPIPAETIAQNTKEELKSDGDKPKIQKKNSESSKESKSLEKKLQKKPLIIAKAESKAKQTIEKENLKPKNQEKNIEDIVKEEIEKNKAESEILTTENEFQADNGLSDEEFIEQNLFEDENSQYFTNLEPAKKSITLYSVKTKLKSIKNKFINKLKDYGISLNDLLFMGLAAIFSFFVMLFILNGRSNNQARLKSKNDLMETLDKNNTLTPKKQNPDEVKQKNDGQYFVFDKNIKQTGFCDPATSAIKRNYELTSYEPDLRENYGMQKIHSGNYSVQKEESEYDIIQKILKEDSFIEIAPGEFETISKSHPAQTAKETEISPTSSPIREDKKDIKEELRKTFEPIVLSNVEITPERGFMCVSYNDNISLVGYIFDDVFALYNFKQPKLENYEIKYRLSEKKEKSANFIVKVSNVKMLVRVTKSTMNLEVVLS